MMALEESLQPLAVVVKKLQVSQQVVLKLCRTQEVPYHIELDSGRKRYYFDGEQIKELTKYLKERSTKECPICGKKFMVDLRKEARRKICSAEECARKQNALSVGRHRQKVRALKPPKKSWQTQLQESLVGHIVAKGEEWVDSRTACEVTGLQLYQLRVLYHHGIIKSRKRKKRLQFPMSQLRVTNKVYKTQTLQP